MKQKKEVNYRPKKRRGTTIVPLITLTVLVGVLSAAAAGLWQVADSGEYVSPQRVEEQIKARVAQPEADPEPKPPESEPVEPKASAPEPEPQAADASAYQVPKNEWVGTDYFDDALFVGDSITDGVKLYDIMSNAKVLSSTGINLDNIFTKPTIKTGEGEESKITILEAAKAESPGKIYVMMGANSMGADKETFVKSYGRLVDALGEAHPDAVVYVQSILPVTEAFEKARPEFANSKIDDYNLGLRQMAMDKGLPYVDVAAAFKDEAGRLPDEASPKDGMHFSAQWYRKWFDYLREHTITK